MTAQELREKMNKDYGDKGLPWPSVLDVDAETYLNVCQFTFQEKTRFSPVPLGGVYSVVIHLGLEKGIMFKGVELVMRKPQT